MSLRSTVLFATMLSLGSRASANETDEQLTIESVCTHSMGQTMRTHGDQFLVAVTEEVGESDELAWMIESTRAQWTAELKRQCIESLIPLRKQLVLAGYDAEYQSFSRCVQSTDDVTKMESCFLSLNIAVIRTPSGSAARVELHVNQIRDALLTYGVTEGSYPPIPAFVPDASPGSKPRPWPEGSPFQVLGWQPSDAMAWGAYRVEQRGEDDFEVIGVIDIDGDGEQAVWTASKRLEATRQTDPSIH
jgi:hypothetical protein